MTKNSRKKPGYPSRDAQALARRWRRQIVGILLGLLSGPLLLLGLLMRRRPAFAARTTTRERRRLEKYFRISTADPAPDSAASGDPPAAEVPLPSVRYVLLSALMATVSGAYMLQLLLIVLVLALGTLTQLVFSGPVSTVTLDFTVWQVHHPVLLVGLLYVLALVAAAFLLSELTVWLTGKIAAREFLVQYRDGFRARISELMTTRRGMVQAIDDERRRIERDLHDGAQQKAVATSMLIARARRARDPERAGVLLEDALTQSQELIAEIRQVAWSVYPSALDELGLEGALAGITETSVLAVSMDSGLPGRPPQHVESAAFFVVREALNNAVKHSRGSAVRIELRPVGAGGPGYSGEPGAEDGAARPAEPGAEPAPAGQVRALRVVVTDDGEGRADPGGGGLRGLARRVAALDGTFTVTSPAGGPTSITAEIPYD